jgi:hypothetical protein
LRPREAVRAACDLALERRHATGSQGGVADPAAADPQPLPAGRHGAGDRIIYVATDSDALAWVAFVLLAVVALLGFTMFAIWYQRRQRGRRRPQA